MKDREQEGSAPVPGDIYLSGDRLVVVETRVGRKFAVTDARGIERRVTAAELDHPVPLRTMDSHSSGESRRQLLSRLQAQLDQLTGEIDISALWELMLDEKRPRSAAELAEAWFGESSPLGEAAMTMALASRREYFAITAGRYLPRDREKVRELETAREAVIARERLEKEAVRWFSSLLAGKVEPPEPAEFTGLVKAIEKSAVCGRADTSVRFLLDGLGLDERTGPMRLMIRLGRFGPHENVLLKRYDIPVDFPAPVLDEAERICRERSPGLRPVTARQEDAPLEEVSTPVFTVDDHGTRERDDGISVERLHGAGWRFGIHITDLSGMVRPGGIIDTEARRRAETLYLPEKTITMLPPLVSYDLCSLSPGTTRPCVSLFVETDDSFEPLRHRFARTTVRLGNALTYEDLNGYLDTDSCWKAMSSFAGRLENARLSAGARPASASVEYKITVDGDEPSITMIRRDDPARKAVAEMMILYNRLAAELLSETGRPAVFRVQEKAEVEEDSLLRRLDAPCFATARSTTDPGPHAGLGLACYAQASSPLRRYLDLLVQRQLSAALSNEPSPHTKEELEQVLSENGTITRLLKTVENERKRYWTLIYLQSRLGRELDGTVEMDASGRLFVRLVECGAVARYFPPPSGPPATGESVRVRVRKVDPLGGILELEHSSPGAERSLQ